MRRIIDYLRSFGRVEMDEIADYFESVQSIFELKAPLLQISIGLIGGAYALIADYLFHDPEAIAAMVLLFLMDLALGALADFKGGAKKGSRAMGTAIKIIVSIALMVSVYQFSKSNEGVSSVLTFLDFTISGIVYFVITSQVVFSILESSANLGVIPPSFVLALRKAMDWHALWEKLKK